MKRFEHYIFEKLKVSTKSNSIKVNLGYFLMYQIHYKNTRFDKVAFISYMFKFGKKEDLFKFELDHYFNSNIGQLVDFFDAHKNDIVELEETEINPYYYNYSFEIDGKHFESPGWSKSFLNMDAELIKGILA